MAKKGYIIETRLQAKDVEALNETAIATVDVDGGAPVTLGAYSNGVYTATKGATAGLGSYVAYNPSERYTLVDGQIYAGLSVDPRAYTNLATRPMDVFRPVAGDKITFTVGNLKTASDEASIVAGKFLEWDTTGYVIKATATASTFSVKVLDVVSLPFPQAGIGMEFAKGYRCVVVQN